MSSTPRELPASLTRIPTCPASTRAVQEENRRIAPMMTAIESTSRPTSDLPPSEPVERMGDAMPRVYHSGRPGGGRGCEAPGARLRETLVLGAEDPVLGLTGRAAGRGGHVRVGVVGAATA